MYGTLFENSKDRIEKQTRFDNDLDLLSEEQTDQVMAIFELAIRQVIELTGIDRQCAGYMFKIFSRNVEQMAPQY